MNFDLQSLDEPVEESAGGSTPPAVRFVAQPGSDRLQKVDNRGRPKYETKRWVDLTNHGDIDAEHVTVKPLEGQAFWMFGPDDTTIHAHQTRRYPYQLSSGSPRDPQIRVAWTVADEPQDQTFHIG